jgi:hypothetical protein
MVFLPLKKVGGWKRANRHWLAFHVDLSMCRSRVLLPFKREKAGLVCALFAKKWGLGKAWFFAAFPSGGEILPGIAPIASMRGGVGE